MWILTSNYREKSVTISDEKQFLVKSFSSLFSFLCLANVLLSYRYFTLEEVSLTVDKILFGFSEPFDWLEKVIRDLTNQSKHAFSPANQE